MTPRYPENVLPGGRLRHGRALVFPNLFPLAALHAVVTYPERHFLRPSEFEPELLHEGFGAALEFARRAEAAYGDLEHLELCCNHMLPAGASMVHPHFQVFGGAAAPWLLRRQWECEAAFREREGVPYWQALVDEETARGERLIDDARRLHVAGRLRAHRRPRGRGRAARARSADRPRRRPGRGALPGPVEGAGLV